MLLSGLQELPVSAKLPLVFVYKDGRRYQFNPLQDSSLTDWVNEERFIAIQPAKGTLDASLKLPVTFSYVALSLCFSIYLYYLHIARL